MCHWRRLVFHFWWSLRLDLYQTDIPYWTLLFHIGIVRHFQARQKTVGFTSLNRLPGISTLNCSFSDVADVDHGRLACHHSSSHPPDLFIVGSLRTALFPVMDFACVPLASFGFSFLVVIEIGSLPDRYTLLDPTFPYWNSSTFSSATKNYELLQE